MRFVYATHLTIIYSKKILHEHHNLRDVTKLNICRIYAHLHFRAITELVAEWYERWRCDHSEAVRVGSKPGTCKELLALGKKLAWAGASGIREMWRIPHRLAPGKFATFLACVSQ
jgi:hypothetical protein